VKTVYDDLYDTARDALTAVLINQGLQPTAKGGDKALYEAVYAQISPSQQAVIRPFDQMRQQREAGQNPEATKQDVRNVTAIIGLAERLLDELKPF
jgi:hypothetical protein